MSEDLVWNYKGLNVFYKPELDGAGSRVAQSFVDFVARRRQGAYGNALEWCAGPGFIGFALLREGLCRRLCLIDINPAAIDCIQRTIRENGLEDQVTARVGDNLQALADDDRFDLVVANPPNFCALNVEHVDYSSLKDDLRPNDPGWRLHRGFYSGIRRFLSPGAVLHVSEVEPEKAVVFLPHDDSQPWDIRPRPALEDFVPMIEDGGLRYVDTEFFFTGPIDGAELSIMTSVVPTELAGDAAASTR
jgi:predicted RNA methylase